MTSAHSDAFTTLAGSGGMQGFCQACHTVTELGNPQTDTAVGFRTTRDERYHDVQCESCHGPGLEHVTNPDATQPLASIAADTIATTGCGECHSGVHNPFIMEWRRSAHGRLVSSSTATSSANCVGCHTAQGALNRWGERANYVERGGAALPQTCAVCHDPHGSPNTKQLRHPIDSPDENRNLCMQCHNRRATPDPASSASGPHAPEGPTILGFAGWWPPAMEWAGDSTFLASHGSARNPRLCATCHVERYEIRDTLTDDFLMQVTGHSFLATPCVDANGIPTGDTVPRRHLVRVHAADYARVHGTEASARQMDCTSCHVQKFCSDCHAGEGRRRFHPANFVQRHAPEAWGREQDCASCHNPEAFCRSCHASAGLVSSGGLSSAYHTRQPGWLLQHGQAARQGLESCTTCHVQRDCMQCHSRSGWNVSPHGPGFDAERMQRRAPGTCAMCHVGDPLANPRRASP